MDEEIERLVVSVRADTGGFARDVAEMRGQLEGPLAAGADRAGRAIENALLRAVRTGKFGFEDLKRLALQVMADIAAASIRSGIASLSGGGGSGGGGGSTASLISLGTTIAAAIFGAPGRATGGPVAPGRPYLVGERGPELFVPTGSGRIETGRGGGRDVNVRISINAPEAREPQALARSSRQVARAVKQALTRIED
ncbi:MAG: tail tape measure protein [Alphaproteobacteria bacterium]|nr:MAG: tail tape measure protein [Alphaproteobacteria bacterium]